MLTAGLVEEVGGLLALRGVHAALPAMRAVGYRQVVDSLCGRAPLDDLAERGIRSPRANLLAVSSPGFAASEICSNSM